MTLCLITIGSRPSYGPAATMMSDYLTRSSRYLPCSHRNIPTEAKLLAELIKSSSRTRPVLILTDSRGQQISSTELSSQLTLLLDRGSQQIFLAIGPADGWSPAAFARADLTIAFGRITLPHELAAIVAAEQIYRALTIRAGHPYHSGH